ADPRPRAGVGARARPDRPGQRAGLEPAGVRHRGAGRGRTRPLDHVRRGAAQRAAVDVLDRPARHRRRDRRRGRAQPAGRRRAAADPVVGERAGRGAVGAAPGAPHRHGADRRHLPDRPVPQLPGRRRAGPVRRAGERAVSRGRRHVQTSSEDFPTARRDGPLLEVDELETRFHTPRGVVRAVDGVSFTLERGRTLGLVGESGCGKSVLSRSIMGLLPSYAERRGEITFAGERLDLLGEDALREYWGARIAMVFQDPMTSLNPVMRIGQQIAEPLEIHTDLTREQIRETVLALPRSVHIPEPERRLRQYPHELSGGMRQRVVIAIALSCGPQLLFADEPTTALDVTVQAQILDLLQEQQAEREMAVVLVSHDLGVVAGRTHDIAVMYAGQIVEMAPTRTLF